MITTEQIRAIIEPATTSDNLFIVDIQIKPGNKISVTIDGMKGIGIDTCAQISRMIDANLDREIEDFELEVSSPGLTSAFKVKEQYIKNIGKQIEILLKNGEKFNAKLLAASDNEIETEIETADIAKGKKKIVKSIEKKTLSLDSIKHTKLVLTF